MTFVAQPYRLASILVVMCPEPPSNGCYPTQNTGPRWQREIPAPARQCIPNMVYWTFNSVAHWNRLLLKLTAHGTRRPEPRTITGTPGPGNKNRSRVPDDSVEFIGGPVPGAFGFFSKALKTHHRRKTCFEIWSREPISL